MKLPFEISLAFAGRFDDHINAESELHTMFASKRLEGEWFDLGDEELKKIKDYTEAFGQVETANL